MILYRNTFVFKFFQEFTFQFPALDKTFESHQKRERERERERLFPRRRWMEEVVRKCISWSANIELFPSMAHPASRQYANVNGTLGSRSIPEKRGPWTRFLGRISRDLTTWLVLYPLLCLHAKRLELAHACAYNINREWPTRFSANFGRDICMILNFASWPVVSKVWVKG